eukprot:CAMPEP_0201549764 /NCGR_PEP_ID=MMETSP0173_2-20130828/6215_1 /ASSEMBLY_ACC=CAM_ASM_000268 /TAXON_ID=218659 /ORGANISM="Vexillifera sp., Strain DIVA3 564/2" /LENGTH=659 /DNA_ID=CAMNT_0047959557 /DNA_START=283 /DNA_END=2259 /DNA_ORIENTATION=+
MILGYQWSKVLLKKSRNTFEARVERDDHGGFVFFANDVALRPFNTTGVLERCEPVDLVKVNKKALQACPLLDFVLKTALFCGNTRKNDSVLLKSDITVTYQLRKICEQLKATKKRQWPVFDWSRYVRAHSVLPKHVFRDLYTKFITRQSDRIEISAVSRAGKTPSTKHSAVRYMTEGVMLRLVLALAVLYPDLLRVTGRLRFKVNRNGNEQKYVHLIESLKVVSFDSRITTSFSSSSSTTSSSSSSTTSSSSSSSTTLPSSTTTSSSTTPPFPIQLKTQLWPHQQTLVDRVAEGVAHGSRGFADASAVGSGKTLSSLAAAIHLLRLLPHPSTSSSPVGAVLVLLPTIALINEWKKQIDTHTVGFHVVTQASNGKLSGRITPFSILLTTLGRCRDHPLYREWAFVIIDECLSVQNSSALQTAEAWCQVASSSFGVLMLSATFFRSRFRSLFYMLRMLNTGLPLEQRFLNAILKNSIAVAVPENDRTWTVHKVPIDLDDVLKTRYDAIRSGNQSAKLIYAKLKKLLYRKFDALEHMKNESLRLVELGFRVLLFANTEKDRVALESKFSHHSMENITCVTVHAASHGLNFQHQADAIVCRPVSGDVLVQMKGRIDRPGQETKELWLSIVYANNTIEQAQIDNIDLCGRFLKQYLDPMSERFF